jgi:lysophospholipase L1-like esterase
MSTAVRRRSRHAIGLAILGLIALSGCGGGGGSSTSATASGSSQTPSSFDFGPNDPRRVSAFGDSITFGVLELRQKGSGLATSSNYPAILQNMLRGLDKAFRVTNRGVPGERTPSGVTRVPGVLAADRPGFLLLMEGTNDASHDDDPSFIVANLETMVIRAQASKTIPVVATIPPNFRHDPTAQDIIDSANTLIRSMARSHRIVVAEIFDGMNDRSLFGQSPDRDPLHPNERGYAIMAGIWFDAMQRAIPPPAAPPAPTPPASTPTAPGAPPASDSAPPATGTVDGKQTTQRQITRKQTLGKHTGKQAGRTK